MKIKLNSGAEYWVSWKHKNTLQDNSNKLDGIPCPPKESFTECKIENKTNSSIKGTGYAMVGKNEKFFNKDKGRKVSLKRAMQKIGLNKETRTLFWYHYHLLTNNVLRIKRNRCFECNSILDKETLFCSHCRIQI